MKPGDLIVELPSTLIFIVVHLPNYELGTMFP